jgi:hypothetical protein
VEDIMQERTIGIGHNGSPLETVCPPWLLGAEVAIFRRERPVTTAGRARTREWVLRFERRSPPFIEPLMGWTGGDDPLANEVELTFRSREEAVGYAERYGLTYRVRPDASEELGSERDRSVAEAVGAVVWLSRLQAGYGRCDLSDRPDLERAFVNPAAVFASPDDVVRHPLLSLDCKREILWRWAWDEYLIEIAQDEGMAEGPPSRLAEVKAALRLLGTAWSPDPAAPAMFAVRLDRQDLPLAA